MRNKPLCHVEFKKERKEKPKQYAMRKKLGRIAFKEINRMLRKKNE